MKYTKEVYVKTIEFDDNIDKRHSLVEHISTLQNYLSDIPEQYRENVSFSIVRYNYTTDIDIHYKRPMTETEKVELDEQLAKAKLKEEQRRQAFSTRKREQDLKMLRQLFEKYPEDVINLAKTE